jgi:flagellar biosynthetic protein FlhB
MYTGGLFLKIAGPIFLIAIFFSILANVAQFGFMFLPKLIKFDIKKIAPKFNRIVGNQAKQNLVKSLGKLFIIAGGAFIIITGNFNTILNTIYMHPKKGFSTILEISFIIILLVSIVFGIFSILDYIWQKKTYNEQLKMTKHEVKEELKDTEMDPHVKRRLREKHNDLMRMRTIEEKVPEADVVVRNPDHYAVALKYDLQSFGDRAPVVVSKGINRHALKIIEIAEQNDVYVHQDKELAQDLYNTTNEGDELPAELWQVVVNVFMILYQKQPEKYNMVM